MNRLLDIGNPESKILPLGIHIPIPHWGWPDIPGPGDVMQYFADLFSNAYTGLLEQSLKALQVFGTPSAALITSDWYSYFVGSWYGVSYRLMTLMVIIVALVFTLSPWGRHEGKISTTITSLLWLSVFGAAFYPVTGILIELSHALTGWVIQLSSSGGGPGSPEELARQVFSLSAPQNLLGLIVSSGISMCIWFFVLVACLMVQLCTLLALGFYPVAIVLRIVPKFGPAVFSLFNAMLFTGFFAGPVMAAELSLGIFFMKSIQTNSPEVAGVAAPAITMAIGLAMLLTPLGMMFLVYRKSVEMTGAVTSMVEDGVINVTASDPLSVREARQQIDDSERGFGRELISSAALATIDDQKGESMVRRALDIGATAATATGHVEVAAAMQVAKRSIPLPNQEVPEISGGEA